jgi:hypothetical protein
VHHQTIEEALVGARQKLNSQYVAGAIGVAAVAGLITGSWLIAVVTGALAVGMAIHAGDIRFTGRR